MRVSQFSVAGGRFLLVVSVAEPPLLRGFAIARSQQLAELLAKELAERCRSAADRGDAMSAVVRAIRNGGKTATPQLIRALGELGPFTVSDAAWMSIVSGVTDPAVEHSTKVAWATLAAELGDVERLEKLAKEDIDSECRAVVSGAIEYRWRLVVEGYGVKHSTPP